MASNKMSDFVLAFDTDWAPQFVIDYFLDQLSTYQIPATIFCTSPYLFPKGPLFEKALHPNFMPDSTQGKDENGCMDYLQSIYPEAVGSRSHRLYWHSGLRKLLVDRGIVYDASLPCPMQTHLTFYDFDGLIRFPVWWSDGYHLLHGLDLKKINIPGWHEPGLKLMVFHPIHIYCNTRSYAKTQDQLRQVDLPKAQESDLVHIRNSGPGMESLFIEVLKRLSKENRPSTLKDLCSRL